MASEGPRYPATATNLSNAGSSEDKDAWVSPTNVGADDGTTASITAASFDSPDISQILVASSFGFTIPGGSTIDGIVVEIDRNNAAGAASDNRVQLAKGTAFADLVGANKADTATDWPAALATVSYGTGTTDLWGTTWTVAEINAPTFAVFLSVQADAANTDVAVDFIRVTVYYTEPQEPTHIGSGRGRFPGQPHETLRRRLPFPARGEIAAGQLFTISLAGTITPAGSLIRDSTKTVAGSITPAGVLAKLVDKLFGGTVTPAGSLTTVRVILRDFSGTITPAGALAKLVDKTVGGTITPSGAVTKNASKTITGAIAPAGSLTKDVSKPMAGSLTPTGALELVKVILRNFSGTITPTGGLTRDTQKAVAGTVTPAGTVSKATSKTVSGTVTPAGTLAKSVSKLLSGQIIPAGALSTVKVVVRTFAGSITPAGSLTRITETSTAGSIAPTGTLTRSVSKSVGGTVTPTGVVAKLVAKVVSGTLGLAGALQAVLVGADQGSQPGDATISDHAVGQARLGDTVLYETGIGDQAVGGVQLDDSSGA